MSATKKNIKAIQSPKSQKTPTKPQEKTPKKIVKDAEPELDEGEQMNIVNDNVPANAVAPQHSLRIRYKSRKLIVRVTLHKIPDKCLKFEPTATHFYLDTFKYSKKYYLHFPYPREIEVDSENVDATLEYGILTAIFPITHITDLHEGEEQPKPKHHNKRKQDDAQLKSKQANKKQKTENGAESNKKSAQHVKEEVTPVKETNGKQTKKQNKPVKQSEDAMELEESHETTETSAQTNKKTVKKEPTNGNAKKNQPKKSVAEDVTDDTEEQPQEKKKKSKNFVNDSVMLDIADQINDAEDKKRASKITKEASKQQFFEQQAKKKEDKKQKQAALKKQVLNQVMTQKKQVQQEEEELDNKVVTRRVSFGEGVKDNGKGQNKGQNKGQTKGTNTKGGNTKTGNKKK